jgi:hypothetical protein
MKKVLGLSLLTLALVGGVASADHGRGRGRWGGSRAAVSWRGGVVVQSTAPRVVVQPRVVVRPRVVRRPIYVQRPAVTVRYYNYDSRPAMLSENYSAMPGYYWVNGQWNWNGYEWNWTAGHYEPDPSYVEPQQGYYQSYDDGCDHSQPQQGYYDNSGYYDQNYQYSGY